MAILFPPGLRLFDADGAPLSGAKIRVYTANTTSLASLFSDSGLTSAITNPVITDAAGYPSNGGNECGIYCASGTYDVAFLTSADVVFASWDDMVPWGTDAGDINQVVTGNGRFEVTGAAGSVFLRAGDPDPDDVGGTLVIEGWDGTQLDTLTIDAATANITGRLQENGKTITSVVQTAATTFTAVTEIDIAIPETVSGIRAYRIDIFDLVKSTTTGNIRLRLAYDGVPTFKTGAADYHSYVRFGSAGGVVGGTNVAANGYAEISISGEMTAAKPGWLEMEVLTPDSGSTPTIVRTTLHCMENGAVSPTIMDGTQYGLGGYGRVTHVRIYSDTGDTFTGSYRVAPIYGFGGAAA
jgi:hypothetical protein